MFLLWKAFRKCIILYCVGQFKMKNSLWCRRNDHYFKLKPRREKIGNASLLVDLKKSHAIPCPNGSEASFINSATSIREVFQDGTCDGHIMPPLEASLPLPAIFAGSFMGFAFLGKSDWLPFVQVFWYVREHSGIFYSRNRNIKPTYVCNCLHTLYIHMCKRSNIFYEHNIKFVFAHVNHQHVQTSQQILSTGHQTYVRAR